MKKTFSRMVTLMIVAGLCGSATWAGDFSPGKGGQAEAGIKDAGIPGFVGPAGAGVTADGVNGNYLNPIFVGWATGVVCGSYRPSDEVGRYGMGGIGEQFADPAAALGPITGDVMDVVSLGDMNLAKITAHLASTPGAVAPGTITLTFDKAIRNVSGAGADFVVFSNGFVSDGTAGPGAVAGLVWAELAYVEVSTDGVHFARFPSEYTNFPNADMANKANSWIDLNGTGMLEPTAYLSQEVSTIYNLAGKHCNSYGISWGTPFDLDDLLTHELVLAGLVNLSEINFVRIVDIPGDGSFFDSHDNRIFDGWVTWGSGGFDLAGIGVIHQVPEPTTVCLLLAGLGALARCRRKSL